MVSIKKLLLATSLFLSGVVGTPASQGTQLNALEKRDTGMGKDASRVCESEFVVASQIKSNGNSATVVDLTGCTGFFFFKGTTLVRVAHVLCGNEATDGKQESEDAEDIGADSVTIAAFEDKVDAAKKAANDAGIETVKTVVYTTGDIDKTTAVRFTATSGSTDLTRSVGPRICTQTG